MPASGLPSKLKVFGSFSAAAGRRSLDSLCARGCRPFYAENEHTGSFSGRYEPRDDTEAIGMTPERGAS